MIKSFHAHAHLCFQKWNEDPQKQNAVPETLCPMLLSK